MTMCASDQTNGEDFHHGANGSTGAPVLTDEEFKAECAARNLEKRVALVAKSPKPGKGNQDRSPGAEAIAEKRALDRKNKQFNIITTVDPEKRKTIRRAADVIAEEDSTGEEAIKSVIDDPAVRDLAIKVARTPGMIEEIERALHSAADAERGRRTSAPDVAAAVDAIIETEPLRKLVETLTAKADDQLNLAAPAHDHKLLGLLSAIARHAELRQGCFALASDSKLRKLCIALRTSPELVAAFSRTQSDEAARDFLLRALAADNATQRNLITAFSQPEILQLLVLAFEQPEARDLLLRALAADEATRRHLVVALSQAETLRQVVAACQQPPVARAIGIAVRNPRAPALGATILQLRGSSGWIVHTVLRMFVGKV